VELTLPPPPAPSSASAASPDGAPPAMAPAALRALNRLLAACGVAASLDEGAAVADAAAHGLLPFLRAAAEATRQREHGAPSADVQIANLRGALRLAKGVVAGFATGPAPPPLGAQLAALRALAAALDAPGIDLRGCSVMLGHGEARLDAAGVLWLCLGDLPPAESAAATAAGGGAVPGVCDSWRRFLGGVDADYARARRAAAAGLRQLEAAVAAAAGLAAVYTAPAAAGAPPYRAFLEALAAHAAAAGPAAGGALRAVPLMVAPPGGGGGGPDGGFRVDEAMGFAVVPCDALPAAVYAHLSRRGAAAAAILAARAAEAADAQRLADAARARLRLRRLQRGADVTPAQFRAACAALIESAARSGGTLADVTDGLSIEIGATSGLTEGSPLVRVAWDGCALN